MASIYPLLWGVLEISVAHKSPLYQEGFEKLVKVVNRPINYLPKERETRFCPNLFMCDLAIVCRLKNYCWPLAVFRPQLLNGQALPKVVGRLGQPPVKTFKIMQMRKFAILKWPLSLVFCAVGLPQNFQAANNWRIVTA